MLLKNKTFILKNLTSLCDFLKTKEVTSGLDIYSEKIIFNHRIENNYNSINIWRSNVLFNYWYNDLVSSYSNFIATINYKINEDNIKVEYFNVNDSESIYPEKLNGDEEILLINSLIEYIKNIAVEERKKKIIIDAHHNLKLYNKNYHNEGFIIKKRRYLNNSYCIEAEYNL